MAEVDIARLKHAHDLESLGWLAVEGNRRGNQKLPDESLKGDDVDVEVTRIDESQQSVDKRIGSEDRLLEERIGGDGLTGCPLKDVAQPSQQLGVEEHVIDWAEKQSGTFVDDELLMSRIVDLLVVQASGEIAGLVADERRVAMTEHRVHVVQTEPMALAVVAIGAKINEMSDKGGNGRLRQRITRCDVHFADLVGQTMHQCLEQVLIAHDDGRLASVCNAIAFL